MTDIQQTSRREGSRRRPFALLSGAAMAGVFALAVASAAGFGGQLPGGSNGTPPTGGGDPAGGGGSAMCLVYDAANLPIFDVVFDGTVTAVDGDRITFQVNVDWKGAGETITLTAPEADVALVGMVPDFEVGGRYLVSASEGNINACNYSLDYDAGEAADWAAAFSD